jgi:hypothetical protein
MSRQPNWELIANLGDANPIDYGGYFVYRDTTGVYPEEAEKLFTDVQVDNETVYLVYRFSLDRLKQVTIGEEVFLIPIKFDESWPYAASQYDEWFHKDLAGVASFVGQTLQEMRDAFCSDDPRVRAFAYEALGDYHGWENLDSYPLTFTERRDVEARYKHKL